jgi:hypothetical protein
VALLTCVAIYDAVATLALLFNLAPAELSLALRFTAELNLFESPLYVVLGLGSALLLVLTAFALIRLRQRTLAAGVATVAAVALGFAAVDFVGNASPHYHYGTTFSVGHPMESAVESSGFGDTIAAGKPDHILLVMVEALGQFADPRWQALLLGPFSRPTLTQNYDVAAGMTTYFGSTTAAEMRELCHSRESYETVLKAPPFECLPAKADRRGYRPIAVHNFSRLFFDRWLWYPRIGFRESIFGEDLTSQTQRRCGGPFKAPCDTDVIPIVGKLLQEASQPAFIYWLTLNTHVPIAPKEGTPRLACETGGPMQHAEVCYMTEMWLDLFHGLGDLLRTSPPTDVLIVGDHAPPLWSKAGRALFIPGKVPWIRLSPRR